MGFILRGRDGSDVNLSKTFSPLAANIWCLMRYGEQQQNIVERQDQHPAADMRLPDSNYRLNKGDETAEEDDAGRNPR